MKSRRILKAANVVMAAAVTMAMSAPLYADPEASARGPANPVFQKLDTNHDGYIDRNEAAKLRNFSNAFDEADDNHDGRLDQDEFLKAQAIYDRMRAKAYIDDSVITAKVKAALVKDRDVSAFKVNVKTDKGIVLLSGFVENEHQARRAREITSAIKGVKSVKSNLVVKS